MKKEEWEKLVDDAVTEICDYMSTHTYSVAHIRYPGESAKRTEFLDKFNPAVDEALVQRLLSIKEENKHDPGT